MANVSISTRGFAPQTQVRSNHVGTVEIGQPAAVAEPRGMVVIGGVIYVVARLDNGVDMLDLEGNVILNSAVEVGLRPVGIATDGERIYVANTIDNSVSVLEFP